jgi:hypothetical protein
MKQNIKVQVLYFKTYAIYFFLLHTDPIFFQVDIPAQTIQDQKSSLSNSLFLERIYF